MLVYITNNNFNKIIRKISIKNVNLDGDLYVRYNKILNAIFSKYEKTELLLFKMLSEEPEKFLDEIYVKVPQRDDSYTWVYEEKKNPCYHYSFECPRLNSDFKNYKIPLPIKYKGIETDILLDYIIYSNLSESEQKIVRDNVVHYRDWWKSEGEILYESDKDVFLMHVNMKFQPNPRITNIMEFKQENSGVVKFDNCTLSEIEENIEDLILAARNFFYANEKHSSILRLYVKYTYHVLVKKEFPFFDNCAFSEEEIKSVLEEYSNQFKEPLKELFRNYFRIKNNPDLKMENKILDELGFVPCGFCFDSFYVNEKINDSIVDEYSLTDEYEQYLNFFLNNETFAKTYISMYYPFTYEEILERWDYLIHGDAHYSVYILDVEKMYKSKLGLSFNKNIRWNSKLRVKYEYGFIDPFNGYIVGTHKGPVEFDERDFLDDILPLDILKEFEERNDLVWNWYKETYFDDDNFDIDQHLYDLNLINNVYPRMFFREFKELFDKTPYVIMSNRSIWDNTLSKIIDMKFCDKVLSFHQQHPYISDLNFAERILDALENPRNDIEDF